MKKLGLIIISILVLASCNKSVETDILKDELGQIDEASYQRGYIRIKVSEEFAAEIEDGLTKGDYITKSISSSSVLNEIGITSMRRLFRYAGKFEERTRREGLHLWYEVEFSKDAPLTKAGGGLGDIAGIDVVEYVPRMVHIKSDIVEIVEIANVMTGSLHQTSADYPFNDPQLKNQWHYYNDGSQAGSREGCDINVFPVWKNYTVGSPDVIVAVVDGGVEYTHEDLAANMWINQAEFDGRSGIDEDNNGFTDDIYGFNFAYGTGNIIPHDHGTHVAGTISAVNDNGIGVSGVAGGGGGKPGVKIMTCQIFLPSDDPYSSQGSGAEAIKYSADNGAVISQNSWGYVNQVSITASDKAAVDYFIKYAGIDEKGDQVGSMKGGLVIFSAGNDNSDFPKGPGNYENVLSVASVATDYTRAYYSNYGAWVDVAAPGGSYLYSDGQVLSTLTGNRYGRMQGTSMACPHVSGIAALLVSYLPSSGLTPDMVRSRIESTTRSIDQYNPSYAGRLGTGLVDTYAAFASSSTISPDPITSIKDVSVTSNRVTLKWNVPKDDDDVTPYGYVILYGKQSLNGVNISDLPSGVLSTSVENGHASVGDLIETTISNLDFDSQYYFAIVAYDFSGNYSALSPQVNAKTERNNPPVITSNGESSYELSSHETIKFRVSFSDPDNHDVTWKFESNSESASAVLVEKGVVQVSIVGNLDDPGLYNLKFTAEDSFGASASIAVTYRILENFPPEVIKSISNQYFGSTGVQSQIDLTEYITDRNEEQLRYVITNSNNAVIYANINDNILYIQAVKYGMVDISITAYDAKDKSCSLSFSVLIRDDSQEVDLYPNPVQDYMYVRTGADKNCIISVYNNSGAKMIEQNASVSPFSPVRIDMTSLSGGSYKVVVNMDGKDISRSVVKL